MTVKKLVFIPDKLNEDALQILRESGQIEIDYRPGLPLQEKLKAAEKASAVIVRSATKVDKQFLDAAPSLELVVRAGVGVDNVDVDHATRRGVAVQNIPEGNVRSAAEHTIGLILALCRNIPQAHVSLRSGEWERSKYVGVEVQGKTLGVVGLGKIGRHVVKMAQGLGFKVLGHDPYVSQHLAEEMGIELTDSIDDLAGEVDVLTVHVPKGAGTMGLIGRSVFSKIRPGCRLINCARGGIVDEDALIEALDSGRLAGAAVDVFSSEPPTDRRLVEHPKVVVTPHLGASTREAQENVALAAAHLVVDYLLHGKLHTPVNAVILDPEVREKLEPYGQLAYHLGQIHAQLLEGQPERIVIKYFGPDFDEKAQSYITAAVLKGFMEDRSVQPVNQVNARVIAQDQGLAVEERSEGSGRYFANMLKVELVDSHSSREVGGARRGRRGLRLVSLDAYQFDAVLEGTLLISANIDRPGMIEVIGHVVASHRINVSYMSLGRDKTGGTAIALLNLDSDPPAEVVGDLEACEGILWARVIRLE
ncbi:MAG: phosphoglycerate dehydrogenase [Planctomycetes bacterium]|nr:phosphoglycerate dehydrogenase [Planctomycetota bacterium]